MFKRNNQLRVGIRACTRQRSAALNLYVVRLDGLVSKAPSSASPREPGISRTVMAAANLISSWVSTLHTRGPPGCQSQAWRRSSLQGLPDCQIDTTVTYPSMFLIHAERNKAGTGVRVRVRTDCIISPAGTAELSPGRSPGLACNMIESRRDG
jgi:hypothetical protein